MLHFLGFFPLNAGYVKILSFSIQVIGISSSKTMLWNLNVYTSWWGKSKGTKAMISRK